PNTLRFVDEVCSDSSGNGAGAACKCLAQSPGYLAVSVLSGHVRCAHTGNVVNDDTLVYFTGCLRFRVGLYAGIPGHACHICDAVTG
ncbi:hypothetical protein KI387_035144, partial [Taxus chinensis]